MGILSKADTAQKSVKPVSVTVATFKKFQEDQTTSLAAMIAFWAFFSIFPLFMVLVTVLGYVLPSSDKQTVLNHVASLFPLINASSIKGLTGQAWPLLVGGVTALWSGLGAVRTVQTAFNSVWEIPYHERPGLIEQIRRSLLVLATIGVGFVVTTLISGLVTSASSGVHLGVGGKIA